MTYTKKDAFREFLSARSGLAHKAEALLLTCIDFRYPHAIIEYMDGLGLHKNYDHVILAGSALGATLDSGENARPHWQRTFLDHLDIARDLHDIKKVYILDHRDCGAYRVFLGLPPDVDPDVERRTHLERIERLTGLIKAAHPDLGVEGDLMERIDGKSFRFRKLLSR